MFVRICMIICLLALPAMTMAGDAIDAGRMKFFESKVRPLLAAKCVEFRGAQKQQGKLRLDSLAAMLKGGEIGASVVPAKPAESLLIEAINYDSFGMPPTGQLDAESIAVLTRWIKMGAPWPNARTNLIRPAAKTFTDKDRSWWAIQPVIDPKIPQVGIGATDDLGLFAVEDKLHVHDIHATIMALLGMDHTKVVYMHKGRPERVDLNERHVYKEIAS